MKKAYREWINKQVPKDCTGECEEITEEMGGAFPELVKVRGHYHCPVLGKRQHWWLKTKTGQIVDPTKAQFPSGGAFEYEEHVEGSEEPVGKCMQCGEYVYLSAGAGTHACSKKCLDALARAYG